MQANEKELQSSGVSLCMLLGRRTRTLTLISNEEEGTVFNYQAGLLPVPFWTAIKRPQNVSYAHLRTPLAGDASVTIYNVNIYSYYLDSNYATNIWASQFHSQTFQILVIEGSELWVSPFTRPIRREK